MYTPKGQKTREHFIRVSADLFNKKGYAGTAISDILDTAGYSKGALYRTFTDKDELSTEAFKYNLHVMRSKLREAIVREKKTIDKVLAIPRYYKNIDTNNFIAGGCPILNTAIEADDTSPYLNKLASDAFKEWASLIAETIEQGKKKGEIDASVSASKLSFFIIASIEGSIALLKTIGDTRIMKDNMAFLEKTIMNQL